MVKRRRFQVTMTFDLELGEDVIDRGLSAEFERYVYRLGSPEKVAEHFAWNLVQRTAPASLDGFADRSDWIAELDWQSVAFDAVETRARPTRRGKPQRRTGRNGGKAGARG